MYVCMYVCIHTYMSVCIYVCIHTYMYVCMYVCMYISVYIYACYMTCFRFQPPSYQFAYTYIYIYLPIYIYTHIYIFIYIHIYIYANSRAAFQTATFDARPCHPSYMGARWGGGEGKFWGRVTVCWDCRKACTK